MGGLRIRFLGLGIALLLAVTVLSAVVLINWGCSKRLQDRLADELPAQELEIGEWVTYKVSHSADGGSFEETLLVFGEEPVDGEGAYWIRQTQRDDAGHMQVREFLVKAPPEVGQPYQVVRLIEYSWGRRWELDAAGVEEYNRTEEGGGGPIDLLLGNVCALPPAEGNQAESICGGAFTYYCRYGEEIAEFHIDNTVPIIRFTSLDLSSYSIELEESGKLTPKRVPEAPEKQPLKYDVDKEVGVGDYRVRVLGFYLDVGEEIELYGEVVVRDKLVVEVEVYSEGDDSWLFSRSLIFRVQGTDFEPLLPDKSGSAGEIPNEMLSSDEHLGGKVTFYVPQGCREIDLVADFGIFDLGLVKIPLIFDAFGYPPLPGGE